MIKAKLVLECKDCIDDVTVEVNIVNRELPVFKDIRDKVIAQGWHLGRYCYCPTCLSKLPNHCETCIYFEGSKTMGACVCRYDGRFTTGKDYCPHYSSNIAKRRRGYV